MTQKARRKRIFEWRSLSRLSLRSRIFASLALMLIPASVLLLSAISTVQGNIDTMEKLIDMPIRHIEIANRLKIQLLQTELPFAQYLNRGESADREAFIRQSVEIDRSFENAIATTSLPPHELDLLKLARAEWVDVKSLGEKLLTKSQIPELDELIARTDEFGRHLSRAVTLLDDLESTAQQHVREIRYSEKDKEWSSISALILIFGLGLVLAIFEAIVLQAIVLEPIRRLEQTVNKYSQGDLSTRISVVNNDEIGHLASAFNAMAERFVNVQTELDYLSVHDNLTGLYNRGKFHDVINVEIQRAKRYEREFSLLLIDIDNFRKVNETYGRLVGDSLLCSVGMQVAATIRPTDIAARYSDDDFAVILSETSGFGAKETAERIIRAIADHPLNIGDGKTLNMTVSIGIATYPSDADNESGLFAQGVQALEKAKASGESQFYMNAKA